MLLTETQDPCVRTNLNRAQHATLHKSNDRRLVISLALSIED